MSHPHLTVVTNSTSTTNIPINLPSSSITLRELLPSWAWRRRIRSQAETTELNDLTNLLLNLHLTNNMDTWEFIPDASRQFTVNSMRKLISASTNTNNSHTKWNKLLPSKVNILTWRVSNKRLPTRSNLDSRGIDLDSTRCPLCDNDIETEDHVFVYCPIARDTWKAVFSWWKIIDFSPANLEEVLSMADQVSILQNQRKFFDAVVYTTLWALWNYRNKVLFNLKRPQKELIFNDIQSMSFNWITSRCRKVSFSWIEWFSNPCTTLSQFL